MEAVVVVIALAVGGLLMVKSMNRDDGPPPSTWLTPPPTHELALVRKDDGAWVSSTAQPPEDSTLTVTLVVPWDEVGERYRGLNVVVR